MIPFNAPPVVGTELDYMSRQWVAANCVAMAVLPVAARVAGATFWQRQSVTDAVLHRSLEMAALLLDIQPGDEVIMPATPLSPPPMPLCCVAQKSFFGCSPGHHEHRRNAD